MEAWKEVDLLLKLDNELLKINIDLDLISKSTGLSKEEIQNLKD